MDESKRNQYLSLMGIDTYTSRQSESSTDAMPITETPRKSNLVTEDDSNLSNETAASTDVKSLETKSSDSELKPSLVEENKAAYNNTTSKKDSLTGLKWINGRSKNGLVVVLSSSGKEMSTAARSLMSKMLNAIQFLPAETGFAEISAESVTQQLELSSISGIVVFGHDAGRAMISGAGAIRVAGEEYCTLAGIPIVVTIHPEDLIKTPDLKSSAWRDLKLIVSLMKSQTS